MKYIFLFLQLYSKGISLLCCSLCIELALMPWIATLYSCMEGNFHLLCFWPYSHVMSMDRILLEGVGDF